MEDNRNNTKRTKILLVFGVLVLSAVSASWTLSESTLDNHECLVSITAREMLERDDWIWPTCNGEPRLVKTPLSYWLVASLAKITGQADEFSARLPSAVFGVLSVVVILYFVNQWLSFRIAVLSAAVWATSLGYIRYSHNARPEMGLTFFIVLCFLSFYSAVITTSRKRQVLSALIFWISLGLGNVAKGPAPLPLILIPLFFYVAIFRKWKKLPKLLPVVGVIIFLAIVLPWPLAIAHRVNWDLALWKQEFVDRFFGEYAPGDYPFYYYLLIMFKYITPWVAFLPIALVAPFYKVWDKKRPVMQFLWLWFVVNLVFLTINGGKRQHYILPSMPAITILIGILIEDMIFVKKAFTHKFARDILRNHIVVITAGAIAGPIIVIIAGAIKGQLYDAKTNPQLVADAITLSIVTIAIVAVFAVLFAKRKPALASGAIFTGIVIWVMVCYVNFINPLEERRYSKDFAKEIANIVPQHDKLMAYERVSSKCVQYFGRVIPKTSDKEELYEHYEKGNWVIATAGHLEKLVQDGRFRKVYFREKAERRKRQDSAGALFHKSVPFVGEDS